MSSSLKYIVLSLAMVLLALAWAPVAQGKTAVFFHQGLVDETCNELGKKENSK